MDPYETNSSFFSSFSSVNDGEKEKCTYYNKTSKRIITSAYEGIPENLLLNFLGWLLLLILFAILRKRAWNYGRIALVQNSEQRWTQLFYGATEEVIGTSEADSILSVDSNYHIDKGFCSWLTAIFRIKDEHILQKCGPDAIQYLSFQRHIIVYVFIVMMISLLVVLPINFQGELEGDEKTFGHTTLSNLDPNSPFLWTHVTLAILFLPLGIIIMRRFSTTMRVEDRDTNVSRTLMITNIPHRYCDTADLHRHFREAYPQLEVQDVQPAYDITRLSKLDKEREKIYQSRLYCENYLKTTGIRLDMRPYAGGYACSCCDMFGCPTVDAIEYYSSEESRLRELVDTERISALKRPLGIAFVTTHSVQQAKQIREDHRQSCRGCCFEDCARCLGYTGPPQSTLSRLLKPHRWRVRFAPSPTDIYWENLSVESNSWYLKYVIVNVCLFLVLFFLTTPAYIVSLLDSVKVSDELEKMSPVVSEFLPTLLLWTVAALLPVLVSYSDQWLSHWTRSEQNHSIMTKTFSFLLFMVLILPSLGLTSAQAFVSWTIHARNESYRWECLFLPDRGAFFVNYVTTSAFIGTALELIRFPELFMYAARLCLARSEAETASVRRAILWEFPFGVQYAWMLLIFAMTIVYSLSCPLITPFGFIYMLLKHAVDRHNLYFAYGPSKISMRIHTTAINSVIVSITLLQLSFMSFSILRRGLNDITIYSMVGFILTTAFLGAQLFLNWCKGFSPISYQNHPRSPVTSSAHRGAPFVPFVLQSASNSPLRQMTRVSTPNSHSDSGGDDRQFSGEGGQSPPLNVHVMVQSPMEGMAVLQRTYGTATAMPPSAANPNDTGGSSTAAASAAAAADTPKVILYQNYEGGSKTEV